LDVVASEEVVVAHNSGVVNDSVPWTLSQFRYVLEYDMDDALGEACTEINRNGQRIAKVKTICMSPCFNIAVCK